MEKKKENIVTRTFRIAAQGKGALVLSCLSYIMGMVFGIVPYLSVYFIARVLLISPTQGDLYSRIAFWIMVAGISILGNMLFTFLGSLGSHRVAFKVLYNFRIRVMEHIGKLPLGFFSTTTTGSIQKTMDENIEKIEGFIAHMLPDILGSLVVIILLFIGLFQLNIWLALTVIVTIVIALVFQMLVFGGKRAKQLWVDVATASQNVTGAFSEYVKGMAEVKLFGQAGTITRGVEDNIGDYRLWELKQYKRSALPMSAYKTIVLSLLTVLLPVSIILMIQSPNTGTMIAVLMALIITPAIYDPLMTCVNYGSQMGMLGVGLDTIDEILMKEPIEEPKSPLLPSQWGVAFEEVSFSYQDVSDPLRKMALSQVSFTAPQGKMTALVGESGSGKSTIGQLLSRFWDVESGAIKIGGINIREVTPNQLMDYVATVFQDTYLFADTIRGNITMNRDYDEASMVAAAKEAQCHEFILSLPKGYDTQVGTGGLRLSGGETQRLSIARAILKNSPVVVLDEALAYSDAENENLIQKAIHNLVKDKTVIIIAHRLQSIKDADQILVLQEGRIIERGDHETLIAKDSEYHTLWNLQHEADAWDIVTNDYGNEGGAN